MRRAGTLCDTGPLNRLLDADDPHHRRCVVALDGIAGPLLTTWPVIAESMYILGQIGGFRAQSLLWDYIDDGLIHVLELDRDACQWASRYMRSYADRPCDLADASLLAIAERTGLRDIFSIDSDFYIYVLSDGATLRVTPGPIQ